MQITLVDLKRKLQATLEERGFSPDEAITVGAPIFWAVTHGNNQGLLKLVNEPALKQKSSLRPISVLKETSCSIWLDGGENNGMLIMQESIDRAQTLLQKSPVAIVGIRGVRSSCGALAYFTEQISDEGNIAVMLGRTPPTVAPFSSLEPLFGTNPIAISFPTNDGSVTFDMATAAIAWYGLVLAAAEGKEVDPTAVIDALGNPTSDPGLVLKEGMVLPFDRSYKGSSIGMLVELLAGPLVGSGFCNKESEWGNLVIGLKPDMFVGKAQFKTSATQLLDRIRNAKTANGRVRLPGDRAKEFFAQVTNDKTLEISDQILDKLGWN
ncbi:MAG: Ldh family oxidoreductase [Candidatus Obscuribacterales bacterium]|nr:Ldh family oxidoreductase [Candidatus Obscuribacterales bacterium]